MFRCRACGSTQARQEPVRRVFQLHGEPVIVKIPAYICSCCGQASYSREAMEKLRRMGYVEIEPTQSAPADAFGPEEGT